jgi:gas vesicle protein
LYNAYRYKQAYLSVIISNHIKNEIMDYGKLFLGVLAGLAAGAALGILFAPEKGDATRKKISKKSKKYADEVGAKYHEMADGLTNKVNSLREEAAHYFESGKAKVKETEAEAKAALLGNGK